MKMIWGLSGIAALLLGVSGCVNAKLAQSTPGAVETQWEKMLRSNYSGWRPPQFAPPGIRDNMSPDYVPVEAESARVRSTGGAEPDPVSNGAPAPASPDQPPAEAAPATAVVVEEVVQVGPAAETPPSAPVAPETPAPKFQEYVVQKGDSISGIAKKFYKDGRSYWRIVKANESLKGNPNRIYPGLKLRIPMD